ncbi:MAG: CPBP family intramembrane metalloprotease [Candidatus Marinimicrobia bacterium]|nr:CPBP family intramembrane metalloprotease [Candidatus Neomarinimicrobiota bacterium]MDP6789760.1 CPBP family intramembrane metalloprotease [Candidatus Neomarinimicrobiota bacterium]MDP7071669.1 CPBP family intramembrane metalloprotease [Candidatus Neomarinimicrobiota bacterium]
MAKKKTTYWQDTATPFYSFVFTLPLFLIYELGVFAITKNELMVLRNGADVLMRQVLGALGMVGMYGFSGAFLIGFMAAFMRQKKALATTAVRSEYLLRMLGESVMWGCILFLIMSYAPVLLMSPVLGQVIQQGVLAIGAGLYEEFVFRVILITGFAAVLGFIFQWERPARRAGAIVLAAGLFSAFHFVGEFGDEPSMFLFMIRFIAGIFLGVLYNFRGFGITAYTHTIYDLIVLFQVSTRL